MINNFNAENWKMNEPLEGPLSQTTNNTKNLSSLVFRIVEAILILSCGVINNLSAINMIRIADNYSANRLLYELLELANPIVFDFISVPILRSPLFYLSLVLLFAAIILLFTKKEMLTHIPILMVIGVFLGCSIMFYIATTYPF